jgi:hypothetical protein
MIGQKTLLKQEKPNILSSKNRREGKEINYSKH